MHSDKRSQRLQPVQQLADREEREQAGRYAAVQEQHQRQQQKLDELQSYYAEYRAAAQGIGDLKHLQESRLFLHRLAQAVRQQEDSVKRCSQQLETIRQQWLTARRHHQSMEHLVERYRRQELNEQVRREQRECDEMSAQRHVWRRHHQRA